MPQIGFRIIQKSFHGDHVLEGSVGFSMDFAAVEAQDGGARVGQQDRRMGGNNKLAVLVHHRLDQGQQG